LKVEDRKKAMEIIERQKPSVAFMAPARAPWSQTTNINDCDASDAMKNRYMFTGFK